MCYSGRCEHEGRDGECDGKEVKFCIQELEGNINTKKIIVDLCGELKLDPAKYPHMSYAEVLNGIKKQEGNMVTHCVDFCSSEFNAFNYGYLVLVVNSKGVAYSLPLIKNRYGITWLEQIIGGNDEWDGCEYPLLESLQIEKEKDYE